ncbi:HAMP domain-containing histidine kinase [Scytonema hofmannii FACHB-248]|uniref:histidine kinase n=1 Tax=Scytonema hofmannii FACHB-248 TaxID=1842502 RepID=A0ABR8GY79_9CYAN|nr:MULTISPECIES: HAMP domain-containing sensor histidine kinase [Nostocales]MBD2608492.1 HAMP domain-containing histidine kinase [Scytonema hofmannii FACHB-248]
MKKPVIESDTPEEAKLEKTAANRFRDLFKFFGEARTQILLWYLLLMVFFITIAIPTIRDRLYARVEARVVEALLDEIADFQQVIDKGFKGEDERDIEQLRSLGNHHIFWDSPTNHEELKKIFDIYFAHELPEDDVFFIAVINGEFYKSSPEALPNIINRNSVLMQGWQKLTKRSQAEIEVKDPKIDSILYIAQPVQINKQLTGVFVVAHTTAGERNEALEALEVVIEVKAISLFIALLFAWLAAGKVLAPLHKLMQTTQLISESDLSQRIPVERESGEIAELAKTFNTMMDRLESSFRIQRNLINDAGHELRTPITIIRGHLELMGDDPEEQRETIALVMDELDRMNRFVEDLLLLANAERPDFLLFQMVELRGFTEELFTKATALADRKWKLGEVGKGNVIIDRQRVTQAVMNLAQNATQHTRESDTIIIGSSICKEKVRFWVSDTGEGIATSDQKWIFERFARAGASRRRSDGAGLGLSIVQVITEAHQGQIYLKSKLGTGSTFTIVLPVEPSSEVRLNESNSHCRR